MIKNFFFLSFLFVTLFSLQSVAATASFSSKDHILKLFEKEIVPSNAEFIFNIYANSKIPFLGFSLYSNQVVEGHRIPLRVVARPDLTPAEASSKGLLMYEFIPEVDFVKKFNWVLGIAHNFRSHSGVSYRASVETGPGLAEHKAFISIGEGDRSLSRNRNYNADQSFMYGTESSVTYLYQHEGEIKLGTVNKKYYRRDESFTRSAPAAKSECAIRVSR